MTTESNNGQNIGEDVNVETPIDDFVIVEEAEPVVESDERKVDDHRLKDGSKAKKLLVASGIMDFVTAAIYLAISTVIIVFGINMINFQPSEDAEGAEVLGEVIGGFFVILVGIIFVFFGALSLVFFIASVICGGTTLGLIKKPIDKVARRVRGYKVAAVFGIIFTVALIIVGIIAAVGGAPVMIVFFLILAGITLATSIVNIRMVSEVQREWKKEFERRQDAGEYYI